MCFGMRLFDLIKDDNRVRPAAQGFGQLSGFFVTHISWGRTHQAADSVPFHEFRHVELDQSILAAKEEPGQCFGQFSLANTCWSQEDKGADRAARIFQTSSCPANRFGDSFDRLILTDDMRPQFFFHFQ